MVVLVGIMMTGVMYRLHLQHKFDVANMESQEHLRRHRDFWETRPDRTHEIEGRAAMFARDDVYRPLIEAFEESAKEPHRNEEQRRTYAEVASRLRDMQRGNSAR
jgi:hypothetical protein